MKEYSLIIPYHSSTNHLRICISTIRATVSAAVETLVIFNNDNAAAFPSELDGRDIRVLRFNKALGYAQAMNIGASEASSETLIFCDADTFYCPDWFESLTRFYHNTPNVGLASSKLLDPRTGLISDFGIAFTAYNAPHPFADEKPSALVTQVSRKVQAACSASMIISRSLFLQLGGFDEALLNFYSDIDLCLRINEKGRECWVVADSLVYHRGNSAQSHRNPYKADIKGLFLAKNVTRIVQDMDRYFSESITTAKRTCPLPRSVLLVDLSSVADRDWHHQLFSAHFVILGEYIFPTGVRDSDAVSLLDLLDVNLLVLAVPILYFVDRYISLHSNVMWHAMRARHDDLVIDRNANVKMLREVVYAYK
jgi:GT2 family glycosyltransferase